MVYSESCYIQSAGIFKIWGIFKYLPCIYDKALVNFTAIINFTNYNYFLKDCLVELNILR